MLNQTGSFAGNANKPFEAPKTTNSTDGNHAPTSSAPRRRDPMSRTAGIGEVKRDHGGWFDESVND